MLAVIDTNVLIVANHKESPQASPDCILSCSHYLQLMTTQGTIVIDDQWHILKEYQHKVSPTGQPGIGDAFLKWVLTNQANPKRCHSVKITDRGEGNFAEFPDDPELGDFDRSDRKFVAVAIVHPHHPPIYNAVDTDWLPVQAALRRYGITVEFLCWELAAQRSSS